MFHNANQWDEQMVMVYDADHPPFLGQADRAEHFIKTVRKIIQGQCTWVPAYPYKGHEDFLVLTHKNDPESDKTLGYMEGKCFFLNSELIYTLVKNMAEQDGIHIQAPKAVYFKDLLNTGVLSPAKRFKNRAYRRENLGDGYSKFICIPNDELRIDVRTLPSV